MNWNIFQAIIQDYIKKGDFDKALELQNEYNVTDARLHEVYWIIGDILFWIPENIN